MLTQKISERDSAGSHQFYKTVSWNFRPALLFTLVPLVVIEPAENITFVMEPADRKFESQH